MDPLEDLLPEDRGDDGAELLSSAEEIARLKKEISGLTDAVRSLAGCVDELHARFEEREADFAAGFKTNDLVWLHGRTLFVNGVGPVTLDKRESILLRILAGYTTHGGGEHRGFLSTETIVEVITLRFAGAWPDPCFQDVHRVVSGLRTKLHGKELNKYLVETSVRDGYRLSTPARNVRVAKDC